MCVRSGTRKFRNSQQINMHWREYIHTLYRGFQWNICGLLGFWTLTSKNLLKPQTAGSIGMHSKVRSQPFCILQWRALTFPLREHDSVSSNYYYYYSQMVFCQIGEAHSGFMYFLPNPNDRTVHSFIVYVMQRITHTHTHRQKTYKT